MHLARRVEKIRLRVAAGVRVVFPGNGNPSQRHVCISVTNLGERTVTVNSVGWAVGKSKQRRFAIQPVSGPYSNQYPIELAHGRSANFMVSFVVVPDWLKEFATDFVEDVSDKALRTLVAQVHTSVGQTVEVHPEQGLIEEIKKASAKGQ
ncbi:MAG: hypothetical protein U0R19_14370 [Bryobacteraceae bacterium]